ncbi:ABC transporter permease [Ensifer sp. Root142]|nr:ABC transporter permease [Ensifer sp. Root142]MDP9632675.1 polar amino acid transport system permease protein [Ensifer adhaerens]NOV17801.1 amino acid ABC transporter permease [Ensifer canadensis]
MLYSFEFADVIEAWPALLAGAANTLWLSGVSIALGVVVASIGAAAKTLGRSRVRFFIDCYIELIRNTPFLVQVFLIFFGLPAVGLKMSPNTAAITAMVVNFAAYAIEIIRAGIESIPKGQTDAGKALGLSQFNIFRLVIFKPALQAVYPALTSQMILLMLNSSVCSAIAATELTAVAGDIQSRTFRSFEVYSVVTAMYFVLSVFFWSMFAAVHAMLFKARSRGAVK